MRTLWRGVAVIAVGAAILGSGAFGAAAANDDASPAAAGTLDDGESLLPQAGISVADAVQAAQGAAAGAVGEVDLESFHGQLVFNVDVGNQDVKVDANDGSVLATVADD